jgi:putative spermidine/putrescine transport system ATP-binding protein
VPPDQAADRTPAFSTTTDLSVVRAGVTIGAWGHKGNRIRMPDRVGAPVVLEGLARAYADGTRAVDGVSLAIAAGEFLTLLGPSGSGKTTTLKMIAGFEAPDAGVVRIGGRDVTGLPPHRRDIGMVFQNYALFPHMSVAGNVGFPLRMRGVARAAIAASVERALAMVRLGGLGSRFPKQLSGGQQQRVALARALVYEPPLLLMDEPLGALDRQLRREVQSEIKRIQRGLGITAIYVTHDQDEALFLSDRIAVMNRGRIVQCGAPAELYARPGSRFVAGFLGESNVLAGRVERVDGSRVRLRLADGALVAGTSAAALPVGTDAELMVRPEKITLTSDALDGNGVSGTVDLASFLGDAVGFEVAAGAAGTMKARLPFRAGMPVFAAGDAVALRWAAEDGIVFAAEPVP